MKKLEDYRKLARSLNQVAGSITICDSVMKPRGYEEPLNYVEIPVDQIGSVINDLLTRLDIAIKSMEEVLDHIGHDLKVTDTAPNMPVLAYTAILLEALKKVES